jgi:hypothetical protein
MTDRMVILQCELGNRKVERWLTGTDEGKVKVRIDVVRILFVAIYMRARYDKLSYLLSPSHFYLLFHSRCRGFL